MRKTMTDPELEALLLEAKLAFEAAHRAWQLGMKVLPVKSREYQAIRRTGLAAQRLFYALEAEAHRRGWCPWPKEKIERLGIKPEYCGFS